MNSLDQWRFTDQMNNERFEKLERLLIVVKEISVHTWFNAASPKAGACLLCDANLHQNCEGIHAQLDGAPCPVQQLHDVLVELGELTDD